MKMIVDKMSVTKMIEDKLPGDEMTMEQDV